ncbi:uncharacterized protein LOC119990743 [Tripterygium wilfordii]|nr:uncharacterized protein LOC119990743 [Tripterygium wilfordii]
MEMEETETEAEILELYELRYSDLMLLAATSVTSSTPPEELERVEAMRRTMMETLGHGGPGLLSVTGFPSASRLRRKLLPLARKLALLDFEDRKRILKKHNLGSDVPLKNPDRKVSSFAMQLRYAEPLESTQSKPAKEADPCLRPVHDRLDIVDNLREHQDDDDFRNLGDTFMELGSCFMELGLCIARACDKAIGGHELEKSLLDSGTAKGRLIHYHSILDSINLKQADRRRRRGSTKKQVNRRRDNGDEHSEVRDCDIQSNLWQQWHHDYGIFTVLTDPMFLLHEENKFSMACDRECSSPSGHTYLQIFNPAKNNVLMVKTSPGSFIIQVGESADIISKGKLRSTLHCVCQPSKLENVSRETFVVFLQPAWSKTFFISDYPIEHCQLEGDHPDKDDLLAQEISKMIPSLTSRLKDGMTFAEFSRETTKQYYGGTGLQSNR